MAASAIRGISRGAGSSPVAFIKRRERLMITSVEDLPRTRGLKLYVVNAGRVSKPEALARLARRVRVGDRVLLSGYQFERTNKRMTGSNWE